MPKIQLKQDYKLTTRTQHTNVNASALFSIDGMDIPNMATLGEATEAAIKEFQRVVTESYTKVPPRSTTPATATA